MAPRRKDDKKDKKRAKKRKLRALAAQDTADMLFVPGLRILVVGDGDFSFSRSVTRLISTAAAAAEAGVKATESVLVATSFDSLTEVCAKYPHAPKVLATIRAQEAPPRVTILHGVDATALHAADSAALGLFDLIVFNFPHSGLQRVHLNRNLVREFLTSARGRLRPAGKILVSLKMAPPCAWPAHARSPLCAYPSRVLISRNSTADDRWDLQAQATEACAENVSVSYEAGAMAEAVCTCKLTLSDTRRFDASRFPSYNHQTTDPTAKKFVNTGAEAHKCKTFVFTLAPDAAEPCGFHSGERAPAVVWRERAAGSAEVSKAAASAARESKKKQKRRREHGGGGDLQEKRRAAEAPDVAASGPPAQQAPAPPPPKNKAALIHRRSTWTLPPAHGVQNGADRAVAVMALQDFEV
jgi:hypothetical protein